MPVEDVTWALADSASRAPAYKLHRDYYEGRHRLQFATDRFTTVFGELFKAFADNLSAPVVDALADRMQLEGFDGGEDNLIADLFGGEGRFRRLAGEVTLEALRCADAFVIAELDPAGDPVAWPQDPTTMAIEYSETVPGKVERAGKVWLTRAKRWRVNIYTDALTERWISPGVSDTRPADGKAFLAFEPTTGEPAETPNPIGESLVVHFANNAPIGGFGRSELCDVVPLQDALNKTIADMLVGSEFAALPQRWAIGVDEQRDPATGRKMPMFRSGIDRLWRAGNKDAKFGQFDAADLEKFLKVQDSFRAEIARVSGTPMYYFQLTGAGAVNATPSGVSLDRQDGRFVRKVEDRTSTQGETWVSLVNKLRKLTNASPIDGLVARWAEAANRDEKAELDVAAAKQALGVPLEVVLVELGYPEALAKQWADQKATDAAAAAAAALASFDRGGVPVTQGQGATIAAGQ